MAKGAKGNPGGQGAKIVRVADEPAQITLAEAGIDKNLADRARKYAAVPDAIIIRMDLAYLRSLRRLERDQWRTTDGFRLRGGNPEHLAELLKLGLIESRRCGDWYFRLTTAGVEALERSGIADEPIRVRRNGNGGWKLCRRGHWHQGQRCRKCAEH